MGELKDMTDAAFREWADELSVFHDLCSRNPRPTADELISQSRRCTARLTVALDLRRREIKSPTEIVSATIQKAAKESRKINAAEFCDALDDWAEKMQGHGAGATRDFNPAWKIVRFAISKSCLLDRALYKGEKPSNTPCPVHKGRWSGCHFGWPGAKDIDGKPVKEDPQLREWYDKGCRCFQHGCGCTTGWQPE